MGFFSQPEPILLGTCELSAEKASEKLARALLPPEWLGKGTVGQLENLSGWLEYRSPYYRYGCGLRLLLTIREANTSEEPSCLLRGKWTHRHQFFISTWLIATALFAVDGLIQTLGYQFFFSTPIPSNVVAMAWLFLFGGLFFLRWSHLHEKEAILRFLLGTLTLIYNTDLSATKD